MPAIIISNNISLSEGEVQVNFIKASGPGGQNINKVCSAVQLRFDMRNSSSLSPDIKERLVGLAGRKITDEGILIIEASRYRSQEQNRLDAIRRLVTLIQKAQVTPKIRRATRPSVTSSAARIGEKKKRGETKRTRRYNPDDWE